MKNEMMLMLLGPDGEPRSSARGFVRIAVFCFCLLFAVGTSAQEQGIAGMGNRSRLTTFDAPDAGTGSDQGTIGASINGAGNITGHYYDASGVEHGFVRNKKGRITTFDAPGAGTGSDQGTVGASINDAGGITGYYRDASDVYHGFVWRP
jgi:hypothetical protein